MTEPLLRVSNLKKKFPIQRGLLKRTVGQIHAVDGISFEIAAGETLGVVGQSGRGQSTSARLILRLLDPTSGEIFFDGKEIKEEDGEVKKLKIEGHSIYGYFDKNDELYKIYQPSSKHKFHKVKPYLQGFDQLTYNLEHHH